MPYGVDNVAVMRCNVERKRDVCASTGEFHRRGPVQRLFWQGTDAKDVGQMPLLEDGREFQEEGLHRMAVERHLYSRVGELVWREALIGKALGAGIDAGELHRAACSVPRHCHRVVSYQHFMLLQEKMIVLKGDSQGVFDVVLHKRLPNFREEDLRGLGRFKSVFCHTKLGQGVVIESSHPVMFSWLSHDPLIFRQQLSERHSCSEITRRY